jgi:hypothetical protein
MHALMILAIERALSIASSLAAYCSSRRCRCLFLGRSILFERRFHRCHEGSPVTLECSNIAAEGSLERPENSVATTGRR